MQPHGKQIRTKATCSSDNLVSQAKRSVISRFTGNHRIPTDRFYARTRRWAAAPAPSTITVRPVVIGNETLDRVTLVWPDYNSADPTNPANAVANKWLQVTVKADANTGLAQPDAFYFGNLMGESYYNISSGNFVVNALDSSATEQHKGQSALIDSLYDHNRDGSITSLDVGVSTGNVNKTLIVLVAP